MSGRCSWVECFAITQLNIAVASMKGLSDNLLATALADASSDAPTASLYIPHDLPCCLQQPSTSVSMFSGHDIGAGVLVAISEPTAPLIALWQFI